MQRFFVVLVLQAALAQSQEHVSPKTRVRPEYLSSREEVSVSLYAKVAPAVVTIVTTGPATDEAPSANPRRGVGSGVLISPEHHVLTAAHVVDDAEVIVVRTHGGGSHPAKLLFSEASADIALLRILGPAPDLAHATLGDSDRLAVGQDVYVIGAPYGLEHSYSVGTLSGASGSINSTSMLLLSERTNKNWSPSGCW